MTTIIIILIIGIFILSGIIIAMIYNINEKNDYINKLKNDIKYYKNENDNLMIVIQECDNQIKELRKKEK